jgi:hypothetical protein
MAATTRLPCFVDCMPKRSHNGAVQSFELLEHIVGEGHAYSDAKHFNLCGAVGSAHRLQCEHFLWQALFWQAKLTVVDGGWHHYWKKLAIRAAEEWPLRCSVG